MQKNSGAVRMVDLYLILAKRPDRWLETADIAHLCFGGRYVSEARRQRVKAALDRLAAQGYIRQRRTYSGYEWAHLPGSCATLVEAEAAVSRVATPPRKDLLGGPAYVPPAAFMAPARAGADDFLAVQSRNGFAQSAKGVVA